MKQLFLNSGSCISFVLISLFIFSGLLFLFSDLWLGFWSNKVFAQTNKTYLTVYIIISCSTALFFLFSSLFFKKVARMGVSKIYKETIHTMIKHDIEFFQRIPKNRIIFRLTKDLLTLDLSLIIQAEQSISAVILMVGGILMLIYLTFGIYGFFLIFLTIYGWKKIKVNLKCSLKMLYFSNNFRSDMMAILMNLLSCNLTLRNMGKENYFDEQFNKISNIFQSATSHLGNVSRRWLGVRMQILGVMSTIIVYTYGLVVSYYFP